MFSWTTTLIISCIIIVVVTAFWHFVPIWMARRRGIEDSKDRLESENTLRKTLGAAIASAGFILPLGWTAMEFALTQRAELRKADKEYMVSLATRFYESMKTYEDKTTTANLKIQAIYELERTAIVAKLTTTLARETPEYYITSLADLLTREIRKSRQIANGDQPTIFVSPECRTKQESPSQARDESAVEKARDAHYLSQAAVGSLGRLRAHADFTIRFYFLRLDNMDLSGANYASADFINAYLRLADMSQSNFEGAVFRNAVFSDSKIPGWTLEIAQEIHKDEWKMHKCWVADFRKARLVGADFKDAKLEGADFRGAKFNDSKKRAAIFKDASIARADFRDTDITIEQLCSAKLTDGDPRSLPSNLEPLKCPKTSQMSTK